MMSPTVNRAEMNRADDIISEPGIVPVRRRDVTTKAFGTVKSGCEGKQPFDARSLADTAAKRSPGRSVYRCKFCRKWHVSGKLKK